MKKIVIALATLFAVSLVGCTSPCGSPCGEPSPCAQPCNYKAER